MVPACATKDTAALKRVHSIALVSFGAIGQAQGGRSTSFAEVSEGVGSVVRVYREGIRKASRGWVSVLLPELLREVVQGFQDAHGVSVVPLEKTLMLPGYAALRRCMVEDSAPAIPEAAVLDRECAKAELMALQEEARVDAALIAETRLMVSDQSVGVETWAFLYAGGQLIYEYRASAGSYQDSRNPWGSKGALGDSFLEIVQSAVGDTASPEQQEKFNALVQADLMSLVPAAGKAVVSTLNDAIASAKRS